MNGVKLCATLTSDPNGHIAPVNDGLRPGVHPGTGLRRHSHFSHMASKSSSQICQRIILTSAAVCDSYFMPCFLIVFTTWAEVYFNPCHDEWVVQDTYSAEYQKCVTPNFNT